MPKTKKQRGDKRRARQRKVAKRKKAERTAEHAEGANSRTPLERGMKGVSRLTPSQRDDNEYKAMMRGGR